MDFPGRLRHLERARRISYTSTAVQQKMAAVVVRGGAVVSYATNHGWNHAEARACRPHLDLTGTTIFVARSNGRVSKPCPECRLLLATAGVKRMVYVDIDGAVRIEMVRSL